MASSLFGPSAFSAKVAFISGAASGIGAAATRNLAVLGAKLVLDNRDMVGLDALAETFSPGNVLAVEVDVTSITSVDEAITRGVDHFRSLALAVNAAGIDLPRCEMASYPAEQWDRMGLTKPLEIPLQI